MPLLCYSYKGTNNCSFLIHFSPHAGSYGRSGAVGNSLWHPQNLLWGCHVEYLNKCSVDMVSPHHPINPPEFWLVAYTVPRSRFNPSSRNEASFRLKPTQKRAEQRKYARFW